jgi:hypothetical protein
MAAKKKTVTAAVGMQAIVDATVKGPGFVYTSVAEHGPLVEQGLVEINPAAPPDANGGLQTRATPKGIESVNTPAANGAPAAAATTAAPAAAKPKPTFTIDTSVPLPAVSGRGRGNGESIYPFDKLEIGHSFFVDRPAKNMASTISSANARFAEEIPGVTRLNRKNETVPATKLTRKFVVRSVVENGVKGSRIWRVEVPAGGEEAND